jgi:hypothetical protein
MSEELRRALHDLSMEVSVVDLRDRALATSRRMTWRHRALAATATVAVVTVVAGVTATLWPRGVDTSPPPSESLSPRPSTHADPLAPVLGERVALPWESLPGTVVYLSFDVLSGNPGAHTYQYSVRRVADGVALVASLGPEVTHTDCSFNVPSVSPDGSMVAMAAGGKVRPGETWLDGTSVFVDGASLFVTDLATGASRRLVDGIECGATIWSPDSARILVSTPSGCRWVDVTTGAATPYERDEGCGYVAFAPTGGFWASYPNVYTPANTVATVVPRPPDFPEGQPVTIQAVSANGRFVALGHGSTDPGYQREARWLYDTTTGQFLTAGQVLGAAHAGKQITNVVFLANGGMVVSTYDPAAAKHYWHDVAQLGSVVATVVAPGPILTGRFAYLP